MEASEAVSEYLQEVHAAETIWIDIIALRSGVSFESMPELIAGAILAGEQALSCTKNSSMAALFCLSWATSTVPGLVQCLAHTLHLCRLNVLQRDLKSPRLPGHHVVGI